jgi:hypothetical protein
VLLGEVLHALLSEINGTKGLRVLRFEALEDATKTGADLVLEIRRWLSGGLQLTCPCLKGSFSGSVSPVVVNHSIAEQTVKPGHNRFAGLEVVPVLKGAEICGLEDVFGQPGVRDTALHEGEEMSALTKELIERRFGHRNAGQEVSTSRPDLMLKH